jgi:hypothetical protein
MPERGDITLRRRELEREQAAPHTIRDLSDEEQLHKQLTEAKQRYQRLTSSYTPAWEQMAASSELGYLRGRWQKLHPGQPDPPPWTPPLPAAADEAEVREYYREFAGGVDLESVIQSEISRSNLRVGNPACPEEYRLTHPYSSTDLAERLGRSERQCRTYAKSLPDLGRLAPAGAAPGKRARWYGPRDLARLRLVYRMHEPDPGPETEAAHEA